MTTYSWDDHTASMTWNTMNLTTGEISLLHNNSDISETIWLGPNETSILYINGTNEDGDGGISLYGADITALENA